MGGCSSECIKNYLFDEDINIRGNKIFKKITINLNIQNLELTEKEKILLDECTKLLREAEKERSIIAKKFETFLFDTGACVLIRPTMERALISYVINLLTQIYITAFKKNPDFHMKELYSTNFIVVSKEKPYFKINGSIKETLKEKYDFDFQENEIIKKGLDSLKDLLSTLPNLKVMLQNQLIILKNIIVHSFNNKKSLKSLKVGLESMSFLLEFFNEITSGISEAQIKLSKFNNLELYFKIAEDAAKNNISDPKEIVMIYGFGENCGNMEKWKDNITYKENHQMKF